MALSQKRATRDFVGGFKADLVAASTLDEKLFMLGGYCDQDAGGWVIPELYKGIRACITEKTTKIARHKAKYATWWLVLVDHIGYGIRRDHVELLRGPFEIEHDWERVVLLHPRNPSLYFDI